LGFTVALRTADVADTDVAELVATDGTEFAEAVTVPEETPDDPELVGEAGQPRFSSDVYVAVALVRVVSSLAS
jgi:hypothetical protein